MTKFTHCGFECMTKVSPMGIPCGYVGLPRGHPYFGKYRGDMNDIQVHGGVTFAGYWEDLDDRLWYVGFDTGHAWDIYDPPRDEFVEEQTKRLAEQLEKVK